MQSVHTLSYKTALLTHDYGEDSSTLFIKNLQTQIGIKRKIPFCSTWEYLAVTWRLIDRPLYGMLENHAV